jgi:hypothetical protein
MSKSIDINGHKFNICSPDELKNRSAVYTIFCQVSNKDKKGKRSKKSIRCILIDVGESGKVKKRIENHDRKECWKKISKKLGGTLCCAVKYTQYKRRPGRQKIEKDIRKNIHRLGGRLCGLR